jgi:hypothetical protein
MCVWNLVCHTEGRKQLEVRAYGTQEDIWAQEGAVTAEWMKLKNDKLHDFWSCTKCISGDQISKDEIGEALGVCGGKEMCIQGHSEETSMERHHMIDMPRWKYHTKIDHNENVCKGLQYIDLSRNRDK